MAWNALRICFFPQLQLQAASKSASIRQPVSSNITQRLDAQACTCNSIGAKLCACTCNSIGAKLGACTCNSIGAKLGDAAVTTMPLMSAHHFSLTRTFDSNFGRSVFLPLPQQQLVCLPHVFHHSHSSMSTLCSCTHTTCFELLAQSAVTL